MPRRRKSLYNNKIPLIFTESPVNKQNNVPSPIYCARHPRTAQSVPVEEIHDLTWVSPQFQSVQGSTRKIKKHRKRRSTTGPKCTCHHGPQSNTVTPKRNTKFTALKFVGEKTPPVTIIEDVSFSFDEDVQNISQDPKSPCLNRPDRSTKRRSRLRRRSVTALNDSRNTGTKNEQVHNNSTDIDHSDYNFEVINRSIHTPKTDIIPRKKPVDGNVSHASSVPNSNDSQLISTPVHPLGSPVKRLFNSMAEVPKTDVFTLIKNRRKGRNSMLLKNLYTSICLSPVQNDNVRVLVADTPESDYGVPYHLRRLRRRQKQQYT